MWNIRYLFRFLPWILFLLTGLAWYLGFHWPGTGAGGTTEVINTTTILEKVEELGRMELVRYNYHELFDYKALSQGKAAGSAFFRLYDSNPDLKAVLIASGEAVGCIDLAKMTEDDIIIGRDTVYMRLPDPELCYYRLDLEKTHVYDFEKKGWWSRLFSDDSEMKSVLEAAYRNAEQQIQKSALDNGILDQTRENAGKLLKPMFEKMSGKKIVILYRPASAAMEGDIR